MRIRSVLQWMSRRALLVALLAGTAWLTGASPAAIAGADEAVDVDPAIGLALAAGEQPDVIVRFRGRADLSAAFGMPHRDRGRYVYETLKHHAERAQATTRQALEQAGRRAAAGDYVVLWIDNSIAIRAADARTLDTLRARAGIESIRQQKTFTIAVEPSQPAVPAEGRAPTASLAHINVPAVWALGYEGRDRVIGNIDTGVRHTHQALVNQYRGRLDDGSFRHDYNWYDPYTHAAAPRTTHPHGSHTVGTSVGDDGVNRQIGIAPAAQWIACIGFGNNGASATDAGLLECGQFMLAPTDVSGAAPDPDLRPDVVNNSWGDCSRSYDAFYEGVVDAWIAAGIVPVFSNGNNTNCGYAAPPGLNTVGNPARYGKVLGIGSTGNSNGQYATHSNWGPTDNPNPNDAQHPDPRGFASVKPNVAAPGVGIASSGDAGDASYVTMSGTSMSAPLVTGLVALIWDAAPCLLGDYARTGSIIMASAVPLPYASGSPSDGPGQVPNQATGWGEIDALAAVEAALAYCGPQGFVSGSLRSAQTGQPIPGARLHASGTHDFTFDTDQDGLFMKRLSAGSYTLTVSVYGFVTAQQSIEIVEGETLLLDITLDPMPRYAVTGVVSDANTGWPLHARIRIATPAGDRVAWTDPESGAYALQLPPGHPHTLTASATAPGYQPGSIDVPAIAGPVTVNVAMSVEEIACRAPGYVSDGTLSETFEGGVLPPGWLSDTDRPAGVGWQIGSGLGSHFWQIPAHTVYAASNDDAAGAGSVASRERLITPPLYFATGSAPVVSFRSAYSPGSSLRATLEISLDDGASWMALQSPTAAGLPGAPQWRDESVDLSRYAGQPFRLAFRTDDRGTWGSGWAVDDILVSTDHPCAAPTSGGLVLGRVLDSATAPGGLNGATVSAAAGDSTVTAASQDPSIGDGFYVLYGSADRLDVTAALAPYGNVLRRIAIPHLGSVRLDLDFSGPSDERIFASGFD